MKTIAACRTLFLCSRGASPARLAMMLSLTLLLGVGCVSSPTPHPGNASPTSAGGTGEGAGTGAEGGREPASEPEGTAEASGGEPEPEPGTDPRTQDATGAGPEAGADVLEPGEDSTEPGPEPDAGEPETDLTEPDTTEPDTVEPDITEPDITEPDITEPDITEPEVTEPDVSEPEVTEPDTGEPDTSLPELGPTQCAAEQACDDGWPCWDGDDPFCGILMVPELPCFSDLECPAETMVCASKPEPCAETTGCVLKCEDDEVCDEGESCEPNGHCAPTPCESVGDCPSNFLCQEGACARQTCGASSECDDWCVKGSCWAQPGFCSPPPP